MKHYEQYFDSEFYIALGYKGEFIKKYMVDYCNLTGDLVVDFSLKEVHARENHSHDLKSRVHLIDTGQRTMTGGRIKHLLAYLGDKTCMVTWGDGISDIDLLALLAFHRAHGRLATVTAVRPPARFGHMEFDGDEVVSFSEKAQAAEGWINGAFFVLEPGVFDYIEDDKTQWELEPMQRLTADRQLMAFKHYGFWQCMDTIRDKILLQSLWDSGNPPWTY
jgi:glucose-1-phosphate cytidylyltransferase